MVRRITAECKTDNHIPLVAPGVKASEHQIKALDDRKQTRAVGDHWLRADAELPEWLQPLTEGLTRRSSSSTDVSPADVTMQYHRQRFLFPRILGQNLLQIYGGGKPNLFINFPKEPNCEVCRRTTVTRAPCKINPDCRADRISIAEKLER